MDHPISLVGTIQHCNLDVWTGHEHAHASVWEGTTHPCNMQDGAYHAGATSPQMCASVHRLLRSLLLSKEKKYQPFFPCKVNAGNQHLRSMPESVTLLLWKFWTILQQKHLSGFTLQWLNLLNLYNTLYGERSNKQNSEWYVKGSPRMEISCLQIMSLNENIILFRHVNTYFYLSWWLRRHKQADLSEFKKSLLRA